MKEMTKWGRLTEVFAKLKSEAESVDKRILEAKGDCMVSYMAINPKVSSTYSLMSELRVVLKLFSPGEIPEAMARPWHEAVCKLIFDIREMFGCFDSLINDETRQYDLYKVIIGLHCAGMTKADYDKKIDTLIGLLNDDYIFNAKAIALSGKNKLIGMKDTMNAANLSKARRGRPKKREHEEVVVKLIALKKRLGYSYPQGLEYLRRHSDPKWKSFLRGVLDASWQRYISSYLKSHPEVRD